MLDQVFPPGYLQAISLHLRVHLLLSYAFHDLDLPGSHRSHKMGLVRRRYWRFGNVRDLQAERGEVNGAGSYGRAH